MVGLARIVTVNLGSQTISIAEFRREGAAGLILHGYCARDVMSENPTDPLRPSQITNALREMLAELGIKSARANYAVPSQSVFTRFVKLPAVEEEKIERIIAFEAQQNVPFPISEVVWDYQLVGGGTAEQLQVVLVAIKSDLLEALNSAVEATGLRPVVIDVATMALTNAFRYNYNELGGCSLLIDIGARTTNLIFVEQDKIFTRNVPIGGSSITSALAKELNEPFNRAEARKKESKLDSLTGGPVAVSSADIEPISKTVLTTMTRLHAEIMRSISHYRSQQAGNAPLRIYLCGGTSSTPQLREFFAEKLQLPIEFFDPLRRIALSREAQDAAASAHLLGENVGLALRAFTRCPMELNLRPSSVVRAHQAERRRPFLVAAAACLIFALLGWSAYYARGASALQVGKQTLDQKIQSLRRFQVQLDAIRKDAVVLDQVATPLVDAVNARSFWPQLLEDLNARLPRENIWITELFPLSAGKPFAPDAAQIASEGEQAAQTPGRPRSPFGGAINGLFVRGLYLSNPRQQEVVVDYFRNLVRSGFFKIDPHDQARVMKPTMPNNTEWAFPYELRLDLKQPIPLP
jgi:type IV pilus assembly protein PilM